MFQRFLKNQERQKEVQILKDLQANMQTLNQLVTYLTEEKQNSDEAIREILRSNTLSSSNSNRCSKFLSASFLRRRTFPMVDAPIRTLGP